MADMATPHRARPSWLIPGLLALISLAMVLWWLRPGGDEADVAIQDVPVIRADPLPVKVRPTDPGGLEVADRDKLVYRRFGREGDGPAVERLLPPPEQPAPPPEPTPPPAPSEISTAPDLPPPPEAPGATQAAPQLPKGEDVVETAIATTPPEPATEKAPPPPAPSPAPAKDATAAVAAPPVPPKSVAAGDFHVQVAALRSETQAKAAWSDLQRKHADLLGTLTFSVVRADLGSKGVFYRVRGGPIASDETARDLCAKLKARGIGCMVVRHGG
jgi:outer membrane biosynthesis protein TonB